VDGEGMDGARMMVACDQALPCSGLTGWRSLERARHAEGGGVHGFNRRCGACGRLLLHLTGCGQVKRPLLTAAGKQPDCHHGGCHRGEKRAAHRTYNFKRFHEGPL